jgi:hypothetical protein
MRFPPFKTPRAVASARADASPPPRWIGIWPTARKNHAVFFESKYSALAKKVSRRRMASGRNKESQNDWWLAAITAGPEDGTFSRPSIRQRNTRRKSGHKMAFSPQ